MRFSIGSWFSVLILLALSGLDLAAFSGTPTRKSSPNAKPPYSALRQRDRARDAKTPAKPLPQSRTVYRYTTKEKAEKDMRVGLRPGKHMTSNGSAGRPLSPATAKANYGLKRQPTVRETIVLSKGQPVRKDKVLGGARGKGEITSTKRVPPSAVKSYTPLSRSQKKY